MKTFRNCLKKIGDSMISLGGGEPTLHRQFLHMLMEAVTWPYVEHVWLATNGSRTTISLLLAKMAKAGIIGCDLSRDAWHDEIDQKVVEAFYPGITTSRYDAKNVDCRGIRDVEGHEKRAGRCDWGDEGCACPGTIVKPNGDVFMCGCHDAPFLGNVNDKDFTVTGWTHDTNECHKEQESLKEAAR